MIHGTKKRLTQKEEYKHGIDNCKRVQSDVDCTLAGAIYSGCNQTTISLLTLFKSNRVKVTHVI